MTKFKFSAYLDADLLKWLEDKVREGKFKSINDGIYQCVAEARKKESEQT